jgi:hypothetical protein
MITKLLRSVPLFDVLVRVDRDIAEKAWKGPCPYCMAGILHRADYPRKPRGHPAGLERHWDWELRHSFCCSCEGCRRRTTTPSVRFLGRRVYLGVVVALVSAMAHGATAGRMRRLREELGVDRRTVERWRRWWRETFVETPFWKAFQGRLARPVGEGGLPGPLWERFGRTREGLVAMMGAISPVTTASRPGAEGPAM